MKIRGDVSHTIASFVRCPHPIAQLTTGCGQEKYRFIFYKCPIFVFNPIRKKANYLIFGIKVFQSKLFASETL